MTNCCFRCGLRRFFSASARSCYRWPGRRCSVPQPGLPAGATSIARAPWVVLSRPGRSVWPLWRRRKYGVWPTTASVCASGRHRTLLQPVAAGFWRPSPGWCPGPMRSGCHSMLRPPPRRRPYRMRAFVSFCAECLPLRIKVSSRSRSSAVSFTTYFFTAISLAATNRLLRCRAIDSDILLTVNDVRH